MRAPLDRILGPFKEVNLSHSSSLGDLLRFLVEETPALKPYAGFGPKDVQPYGLLVWRDGKLLTLLDIVNPTDELEIIPMVAGG
jgi:molybdopterin converting factor small subunit